MSIITRRDNRLLLPQKPLLQEICQYYNKARGIIQTPVKQSAKRCRTRSSKTPLSSPELPSKKQKTTLPQQRRQSSRCNNDPSSSSKPRNRFVFPPECQVCGKYELRYKNSDRTDIREEPLLITLDACAEKNRALIDAKEEYKHQKRSAFDNFRFDCSRVQVP